MTKDFEQLRIQADEIQNETVKNANTAVRVGTMLNDIIDKIEECQCVCGQEQPTTEIEFVVRITEANQNIPDLIRLGSASNNGNATIIWDVENNISETVTVPKSIKRSEELADGTVLTWTEGYPYGRVYSTPGDYTVKIISYQNVDTVSFSTLSESGSGTDWAAAPIDKAYIVRMVKFRSSSLENLYYSFAGLVNMDMDNDFILETPEVSSMNFAFWNTAKNLDGFILPAKLLSRITLLQQTYRIFMGCGTTEIPEGFLDSLSYLTSAFEMFRQCMKLGINRTPENIDNYIPVTLLHKCINLKNITGMFNACLDNHGNYPSWYSLKPTIKKEFFRYTKIEIADYAFNKWNRFNVEPDLFYYIKGTLKSIEGIFFASNQCQNSIAYMTLKPGTTMNLSEIFPDSTYPNITNMIGAFSPQVISGNSYGFNSDPGGAMQQVKLDIQSFISKFPNCKSGSANSIWGTDGRRSAFGNLQNSCDNWDNVTSIDNGIWSTYVNIN